MKKLLLFAYILFTIITLDIKTTPYWKCTCTDDKSFTRHTFDETYVQNECKNICARKGEKVKSFEQTSKPE